MSTQIRNGGSGVSVCAGVDTNNRLLTASTTIREIGRASFDEGRAFMFGFPPTIMTAANGTVLWFEHDDSDRNFVINEVWVGYNGGDTNHNRCAIVTMFSGTGEPTVNHTALTPVNMNLGSVVASNITAYHWDGAGGAGMTVVAGTNRGSVIVGQGLLPFNLSNALVVPANTSVSFDIDAEEIGWASVFVIGAFRNRS